MNGQDNLPRILLAKVDFKRAFRQVNVEVKQFPIFGYVFEDMVGVDRALQFGWTSSPSLWGVFAAAIEHAHNHTTFQNAVITPEGRAATSHVKIEPPREGEVRAKLPPDCRFRQKKAAVSVIRTAWKHTWTILCSLKQSGVFWTGDGVSVRLDHSCRIVFVCLATATTGSPLSFCGRRPLHGKRVRMEILGWSIDTVAMTISVPHEKVVQLRVMLAEWPVDRRVANVKEVRSLLGKLLHLSEVVRPGKFFIRLEPERASEADRRFVGGDTGRRGTVRLGGEFHADLAC